MALCLTRYLVENKNVVKGLPDVPGALVLLSPWCDLSDSHEQPGMSPFTNLACDYLAKPTADSPHYGKEAFLGKFGMEFAKSNRYISPASAFVKADFIGFPRTFLSAGNAELLFDQIKSLRDMMQRDIVDGLEYMETPDAVSAF